jgi:hypothetical protein
VACGKCDWRTAFLRDDLIATHGADYPMPNLLDLLGRYTPLELPARDIVAAVSA